MPSTNTSYFVASCGHIACHACVGKGLMNICYLCKKSGKITRLTSNMDEKVKRYFMDPTSMINKMISDATNTSAKKRQRDARVDMENKGLISEVEKLNAQLALKTTELENMRANSTVCDISIESKRNSSMILPETTHKTPQKLSESFTSTPLKAPERYATTPKNTERFVTTPTNGERFATTPKTGERYSDLGSVNRALKRAHFTPKNEGTLDEVNLSTQSVRSNLSRTSANSSGGSGIDLRFPNKKKTKKTLAQVLSATSIDKHVFNTGSAINKST
ncbi:unnamed protein product [Bursaphelenchus okinawaensis]|uniref:RING-type domain-containing protein n=1 Tax=Bursaphelenchus okinawaensis TaxID=465554 RepID=A0A811L981_9BILA|nr:unnamed protein product [Bursaphelenchus okinawaensis]CAG9118479.1 unnamed protein product [Bursaphelenchus okinawaensis]